MRERRSDARLRRVLLIERDNRLREAIEAVLAAESVEVVRCANMADLVESTTSIAGEVALLAWTAAGGMLAEDQRSQLHALAGRVPLVLMVPSSWRKLVTAEQLGVAGVLAKPFGAEMLLEALETAAGDAPTGCDHPSALGSAP